MPRTRLLAATLFAVLAAALAVGCSSTPEEERAPKVVGPQFFDFTQQVEGEDEGPVDPATCKHIWVTTAFTHPYWVEVNGMPMMRLCGVIRCERCGLVRHECTNPRARP